MIEDARRSKRNVDVTALFVLRALCVSDTAIAVYVQRHVNEDGALRGSRIVARGDTLAVA
jgi:hypothetical protein